MNIDDDGVAVWREAFATFERLSECDEPTRSRELEALGQTRPELHPHLVKLFADYGVAHGEGLLTRGLAGAAGIAAASGSLHAGMALGPYTLERLLGQGGMGEVWLAHRADGHYKGEVAVKTLHPHLARPEVRERFRREGQIVARLSHPNIARLYDAGASADGLLYLVFEYVRGERIDHWCDRQKLDVDARLRLFLDVCAAVTQAHTHLIVHRDLKPSNIMVDADGQVKLLDFGIAKLIEGRTETANETELTRLGGRALTPEYAAPEQVLGEAITTVTDVYSLGVLLYVLLSGNRPCGAGRSTPAQLERSVVETEPVALPAAVGARDAPDGSSPTERAERRGTTPARLRKALDGDLDNIVAKTLRKNPSQRYASVPALAEDIRRHLEHEPVMARGESLAYRSAKFLRRHRLGVAAATALAVSVIAGVASVSWQAHRAQNEAREAQAQARRAEQVKEFLVSVFKAADPDQSQSATMSAREVLDQSVRQMQSQLDTEPALQADLYDTLAQTYVNLGVDDRALELAQTALAWRRKLFGPRDTRVAESLLTVGMVHDEREDFAAAFTALSEADNIVSSSGEGDSLLAARISNELASSEDGLPKRAEALAAQRRAYAIFQRRLGAQAPETARQLVDLAERLEESGDYAESEQDYRAAIKAVDAGIGPDSLAAGNAHLNFASLLDRIDHTQESERELDSAITILRKVLGDNNPQVSDALFSRAILYAGQHRFAEAEADLRQSLRIVPPGSYKAAQSQRYLGNVLTAQDRYAEAQVELQSAVEIFRKKGPDEMQLYRAMADLATAMLRQGRAPQAEPMLREAVKNLERLVGPEAYEVRNPLKRLGEDLIAQGRNEEAVSVLRRVRALELKLFGTPENRDLGSTDYLLGKALFALDTPQALAESGPLADQAVSLCRKNYPGRDLGRALLLRARLALAAGDRKTAHADLAEALTQLGQANPSDPAAAQQARALLHSIDRA